MGWFSLPGMLFFLVFNVLAGMLIAGLVYVYLWRVCPPVAVIATLGLFWAHPALLGGLAVVIIGLLAIAFKPVRYALYALGGATLAALVLSCIIYL